MKGILMFRKLKLCRKNLDFLCDFTLNIKIFIKIKAHEKKTEILPVRRQIFHFIKLIANRAN